MEGGKWEREEEKRGLVGFSEASGGGRDELKPRRARTKQRGGKATRQDREAEEVGEAKRGLGLSVGQLGGQYRNDDYEQLRGGLR
jgi:hypothetical protein